MSLIKQLKAFLLVPMIFFVSVGELTLYSNIHVHVLDCITNAINLCHIAIFPALPNYIMICRHCITTGKS